MLKTALPLPVEAIRAYCLQQPIRRLAVFGSVLREDFGPESDVDLLVTFMPEATVTFFDVYDMQQALSALIGRSVDLLTPHAISPYFADDVLSSAVVIYES